MHHAKSSGFHVMCLHSSRSKANSSRSVPDLEGEGEEKRRGREGGGERNRVGEAEGERQKRKR